jgi:hypothetical protein
MIRPGILLTVRHLLYAAQPEPEPEAGAKPSSAAIDWGKVRIRFLGEHRDCPEGTRGPVRGVSQPLWNSGAQPDARSVDAALLRLDWTPSEKVDTLILPEEPASGRRWMAAGFARVAQSTEACTSFPSPIVLQGDVYPRAWRELDLGVDHPPEDSRAWEGASGAAVLSEGALRGVISGNRRASGANRFLATPASHLLQHRGFCEVLGIAFEDSGQVARTRSAVAEVLDVHPLLRGDLGRRLGWAGSEHETQRQSSEKIARLLMEAPMVDALFALHDAQKDLLKRNSKEADGAVPILERVLPALVDAGLVLATRQSIDAGIGFVAVPATTPTVAGAIMAAAFRREVQFQRPEQAYPRARYAIDAFAPGGAQKGMVERPLDALLEDLERSMDLVDSHDLDMPRDRKIAKIRTHLKLDRRLQRTTPWYIVFIERKAERDQGDKASLLEVIREKLPELLLVEIVAPPQSDWDDGYTMSQLVRKILEGRTS